MPSVEAKFGATTIALFSKCAKCGKPYSPMEEWVTAYSALNEPKHVYWWIVCRECAGKGKQS